MVFHFPLAGIVEQLYPGLSPVFAREVDEVAVFYLLQLGSRLVVHAEGHRGGSFDEMRTEEGHLPRVVQVDIRGEVSGKGGPGGDGAVNEVDFLGRHLGAKAVGTVGRQGALYEIVVGCAPVVVAFDGGRVEVDLVGVGVDPLLEVAVGYLEQLFQVVASAGGVVRERDGVGIDQSAFGDQDKPVSLSIGEGERRHEIPLLAFATREGRNVKNLFCSGEGSLDQYRIRVVRVGGVGLYHDAVVVRIV